MTMPHPSRTEFSRIVTCVGVVSLFALAGVARAQQAEPTVAPPVVDPPAAAATTPAAAPAIVDGAALVAELERAAGVIRGRLEEARRQHDVVKILCLDEKLSRIDVAVRGAGEHADKLKTAQSNNDAELAAHESTLLAVYRQRGEELSTESNTCIGEEAAFVGDTKVTGTVDPGEAQQENADYPAYGTAVPGAPGAPGSVIGSPAFGMGTDLTDPPQCVSCTL